MLGLFAVAAFAAFRFAPLFLTSRFGQFERFNLVVDSAGSVSVISLLTSGRGASVVHLPSDLQILEVAHGYGQYKVSKIYSVGQLDGRGGDTLKETLSSYLGIPIDGFVKTNRGMKELNIKIFFLDSAFFLSDQTDLNLFDRFLLLKAVGSVRGDRIATIKLAKYSEPLVLSDGSLASVVEEEVADRILLRLFVEPKIVDEKLRVEVVNSTDVPGLGNRAARILGGIGVLVVDVASEGEEIGKCNVRTSGKLLQSLTVKRVVAVFGCETQTHNQASGRADVTVIVGREFANLMIK